MIIIGYIPPITLNSKLEDFYLIYLSKSTVIYINIPPKCIRLTDANIILTEDLK
jgi:hypothetical protein